MHEGWLEAGRAIALNRVFAFSVKQEADLSAERREAEY